jgi:hypothetical protein
LFERDYETEKRRLYYSRYMWGVSNVGEKLKGAVLLDKWGKWNLKNKKALSRLWNEQPSLFRAVVRN